jgi:flagellum-specific peptidoglycan hydrolase FlgJ
MALNKAYADKMRPYAQRAANALGMPVDVILAQWSLESGNGTSDHARKYNNHAGIKVPSKRKFVGYVRPGTAFAGYTSLDKFTEDYILNMNNGFYEGVKKAGSVEDTVRALGASPWDAGHYDLNGVKGGALLNILGFKVAGVQPVPVPPQKVCPTCHRPL